MSQQGAEEIRAASYVGFDSITRQIEKKLLKRGFQFNIILVGQLEHYQSYNMQYFVLTRWFRYFRTTTRSTFHLRWLN
jgi:hypothetical protein